MAVNNRIVVVGLGSIGRRHARLLAMRPSLQVEWCEESPQAMATARRELDEPAAWYSSFDTMLATLPSMVVIATPHAQHARQSIRALQMGINVLCEKPLSDNMADAQAMVACAAASSATFAVGFQLHFHPALQRVKGLMDQGALGTVHHLHCLIGTYVTLKNSMSRYQSRMNGALFMDYAHQPDIFYWLSKQRPEGVYAAGGQGGSLPLQSNPNFAAVVCDYASPMISTMHLNYLQDPDRHDYEFIGDEGWIALDMFKGEMRRGQHGNSIVTIESFSTERDSLYTNEHEAFLAAIAGERQPESSAADALISMDIIAAALKSLQTYQRVPLGDGQHA